MSLEQLLFVLLLVALPLLDLLVRAMRGRTDGSQGQRAPGPADRTSSPPRQPVSLPDHDATAAERHRTELPLPDPALPPALPEVIRRATPANLSPSRREQRLRRDRQHGPAPVQPAGRPDRPLAVRRVIAGRDLREAIVLIAVLGHCRALEPQDATPQG